MLERWAKGAHHLPKVHLYGSGVCINNYADFATTDSDKLTRLVLLAHLYAIRIELKGSGPRLVKIIAHRRSPAFPGSSWTETHPTLEMLRDSIDTMIAAQTTAPSPVPA